MNDKQEEPTNPDKKLFSGLGWLRIIAPLAGVPAFLFFHFVVVKKFTKLFQDLRIDLPPFTKFVVEGRLFLVAAIVISALIVATLVTKDSLSWKTRNRLINGAVIVSFIMLFITPYALMQPIKSLNSTMEQTNAASEKPPITSHQQIQSSASKEAVNDARLVPNFEGSTVKGFKVFAIRKTGRFDQLGTQNGDILRSVNGKPISSVEADAEGVLNAVTTPGSKFEVFRPSLAKQLVLVVP